MQSMIGNKNPVLFNRDTETHENIKLSQRITVSSQFNMMCLNKKPNSML